MEISVAVFQAGKADVAQVRAWKPIDAPAKAAACRSHLVICDEAAPQIVQQLGGVALGLQSAMEQANRSVVHSQTLRNQPESVQRFTVVGLFPQNLLKNRRGLLQLASLEQIDGRRQRVGTGWVSVRGRPRPVRESSGPTVRHQTL
jgi:hypothetical protein